MAVLARQQLHDVRCVPLLKQWTRVGQYGAHVSTIQYDWGFCSMLTEEVCLLWVQAVPGSARIRRNRRPTICVLIHAKR